MTTETYIAAIRHGIRSLPPDEIARATEYYESYLADAADPDAAMAALGSPQSVAAAILADHVDQPGARPRIRVLWAVVIGVLAAPVALPLAVALFAIAAALVICALAVVLSLIVAAVAVGVSGLAALITGIWILVQSLTTGLWLTGGGLVCLGLGALATYGTYRLGRAVIGGLARWVSRLARGRAR